jgi:S-methylmethionine-dependent homocysteine/selenocysteine methylase
MVIDGGMGRELERIGAPFRQPEWSALALIEAPEKVREAHQNFVDAGAELIISNAYACVPFHLGEERFAARGAELAGLAARLAREVADGASRPVLVAGSLPPLFGSYEPERFEPDRAGAMLDVLVTAQAPYVDLWLGETLGSTAEGRAVVRALAGRAPGRPLWLSFSLTETLAAGGRARLWSGETPDAVASLVDASVAAVLFNCAPPEVIGPALRELRTALGSQRAGTVRLGAYANAFAPRPVDVYAANSSILDLRQDLTPEAYAGFAAEWVAAGASIVGGCCGTRPDHIAALHRHFG